MVDPVSRVGALLVVALLSSGCPTGDGEGEVVGDFFLLGCDDAFDYGSRANPVRYDMEANFFVGEPIVDELETNPVNRLDIRIQRGGNNIEDVDSVYIQIADVRVVAESFSASGYAGSPVGESQNIRATLSLYLTCPTYFVRLAATVSAGVDACPDLDASDRDALCESMDYKETLDPVAAFPPFAQQSSCLIFCRFGAAERGREVPHDFAIDFGDVVQGFFHLNLVEQRLLASGAEICDDGLDNDGDGDVDETDCEISTGAGRLMGKFNFEVRRGQVAQEFP
jgi:hypothetical protein